MLILTRAIGEKIIISKDGEIIAEVLICDVRGNQVRMGFIADKAIEIHREEIHARIIAENVQKLQGLCNAQC